MTPGPMTKAQEKLTNVLPIVQKLEAAQSAILNEFIELRDRQTNTEAVLNALEQRVQRLGNIRTRPVTDFYSRISVRNIEIAALKLKSVDAEARTWHSNLFFFGIHDLDRETWAGSEKMELNLCFEHFGMKLPSSAIDRAHRLGCFRN